MSNVCSDCGGNFYLRYAYGKLLCGYCNHKEKQIRICDTCTRDIDVQDFNGGRYCCYCRYEMKEGKHEHKLLKPVMVIKGKQPVQKPKKEPTPQYTNEEINKMIRERFPDTAKINAEYKKLREEAGLHPKKYSKKRKGYFSPPAKRLLTYDEIENMFNENGEKL